MPKRKSSVAEEDSQVAPRLAASDSGPTLTLKLDDDGTVDWGRTKESTKEKFKAILSSDPTALEMVADALKDVGDDEEGEAGETPHITADNVGALIDQINLGCAAGIALLVGKFKKHPILRTPQGQPHKLVISPDVLLKTSQLTPQQHEELDPRALKVAKKYEGKIPAAVREHMDIWLLAIMFLKYQQQNFSKMVATQVALDIRAVTMKQAAAPPKPIPPDSDKVNGQSTAPPPPAQDQGGESLEPGFIPPNLDEGTPRV